MNVSTLVSYLNRLQASWEYLKSGWYQLVTLDCKTDSVAFSSKYERFFVCNLQYFQILFGILFFLLIFPILVSVGVKLWVVLKFFGRIVRKIVKAPKATSTEEDKSKDTTEKSSIKKEVKKEIAMLKERDKINGSLRRRIFGLEGVGRYLREIVFFEGKDENFGGPFWSVCFLLSTFITPFVGASFLVPLQMIISALFGFYALYRLIRYKVLLDPKLPYYWKGEKGPGLYILVAALSILYGTVLFTALALVEFFV